MAQTKKHVIVDLDGGLVAKMAIGEVSVRENESRILDTHLVLGNVIDSWTYQTRNQTLGMLGFPVCSSFIATLPPIMLLPGHSSAVATIVSENLRYNDEGHTYEIHEAQGFEFKSLANGNVLGRELSFYVQRLLNMAGQYDVLVDPHAEDATQSTWEEKGLEKTFLLRIREEHNKRFGQLVMADVEHISFEMEDAMYRLSYYPQLIWK
ncbi:hypothetical protein JW721_02385 [Candidatus Micrarchaeota archaeon]|nr:hypothetical protein [Candidatus Micrarchaeota archaeon]